MSDTMTLFDLEAADNGGLHIESSDYSNVLCRLCHETINKPSWISYSTTCDIVHAPMIDGECSQQRMHRQVLLELRTRPQERGNCFASSHDHHSERSNGTWFGYGLVPKTCLADEAREHSQWLADHGLQEATA